METAREKTLEELIGELPEELRQEVRDFVEFLLEKRAKQAEPPPKPTFSWWGALSEYRNQFTSVELQHKVLEWWIEDIQNELPRGQ